MTDLAYHDGTLRPLDQITVGIRTHALHYGTGVFEGIRAYWNAEAEQLYAFRLADHYARLCASAKVYGMQASLSVEELCDVTIDLLARNEVREDVYIRPLVFKSSETMGLWSRGLTDSLVIYHVPLGAYISESGIRCCVSSWRRPDGNFVPARAKISGIYAGMALARREALEAGFDEALTLTTHGKVSEGSGENIFLVIDGKLVTPPPGDDLLAGITRASLIELADAELGLRTVERSVNRSELLVADEVFLCGTAAEVTPVVEIDRRPVGDGEIGPVATAMRELYMRVVRGTHDDYLDWCRPIHQGAHPAVTAADR